MFTITDIRQLITSLNPQLISLPSSDAGTVDAELSQCDIPPFLPSASVSVLYPISVLQLNMKTYIADHGSLRISQLPSLLDIADHEPLLLWADQDPSFSTPRCRLPDLTPLEQKTIAIWFFYQARIAPVKMYAAADFFGVDPLVVEDVVRVYADSFAGVREVAWYFIDRRLWQRRLTDLVGLLENANRELELPGLETWPEGVVNALVKEALRGEENDGEWGVRRKGKVWVFVPGPDSLPKQDDDLFEAVDRYKRALDKDRWCIIEGGRNVLDPALTILKSDASVPEVSLLEQDNSIINQDWPPHASVLVPANLLQEMTVTLLDLVPNVSRTLWREIQDKDIAPITRVVELLQSKIGTINESENHKHITRLVLYSSAFLAELRLALPTHLASVSVASCTAFFDTARKQLQLPLQLYTAPLPLYSSDPTLAEHQAAFLHDFIRSEILPTFFKSVAALDLAPPKDLAKELSRFKTATTEARNVDGVLAAFRKFSRKVKLPDARSPRSRAGGRSHGSGATSRTGSRSVSVSASLDGDGDARADAIVDARAADELAAARDAVLELNLKTLARAKRASDVLQQTTWCLLATVVKEPALFVSGGRDAGRMVKLFQRLAAEAAGPERDAMDWVTAGKELEEFRAKVKEGKQTEDEVRAIRELAVKANHAQRTRQC